MKLSNRPGLMPSLFFLFTWLFLPLDYPASGETGGAALPSPVDVVRSPAEPKPTQTPKKNAIQGADYIAAGELAVFISEAPAAWSVIPETYSNSIHVDSNGRKLLFASPVKGTVSIIAATTADGKPQITVHTFTNGEKSPTPEPTPEPQPEPKDPLEELTRKEILKIDATAADAGREKLADVFQKCIEFIDAGTVQTPAGARETFRRYWEFEAARAGAGTLDAFRPLLSAVSDAIDWSTILSVRSDFSKIKKALTEAARADRNAAAEPEAEKPAEKETPKPTQPKSSCPGGNCPTGTCPTGNCPNANGRFFYRY